MIQGSGAETIKISGIQFFNWVLDQGYFNIVKICGFIHDEILIECPVDLAPLVAQKLQECMEYAGTFYCKIVPLKAVPSISPVWKH